MGRLNRHQGERQREPFNGGQFWSELRGLRGSFWYEMTSAQRKHYWLFSLSVGLFIAKLALLAQFAAGSTRWYWAVVFLGAALLGLWEIRWRQHVRHQSPN